MNFSGNAEWLLVKFEQKRGKYMKLIHVPTDTLPHIQVTFFKWLVSKSSQLIKYTSREVLCEIEMKITNKGLNPPVFAHQTLPRKEAGAPGWAGAQRRQLLWATVPTAQHQVRGEAPLH